MSSLKLAPPPKKSNKRSRLNSKNQRKKALSISSNPLSSIPIETPEEDVKNTNTNFSMDDFFGNIMNTNDEKSNSNTSITTTTTNDTSNTYNPFHQEFNDDPFSNNNNNDNNTNTTNDELNDLFNDFHIEHKDSTIKQSSLPPAKEGEEEEISESEEDDEDVSESSSDPEKDHVPVEDIKLNRKGSIAKPSSPNKIKTMEVNILDILKKGMSLLKYGKSGFPHFRQFHISHDNSSILWYSKSKKLKDTTIPLNEIVGILEGQNTPNFSRHPTPELKRTSFSLRYKSYKKNGKQELKFLDVIAKEHGDYYLWTKGLVKLVRMIQNNKLNSNTKVVAMKIPLQLAVRCSLGELQGIKGRRASELGAKIPRKSINERGSHSKHNRNEVQISYTKMKAKLAKKANKLNIPGKYEYFPQFTAMKEIVNNCNRLFDECEEHFRDGEYEVCDHLIWKVEVELETLSNMMKSLTK